MAHTIVLLRVGYAKPSFTYLPYSPMKTPTPLSPRRDFLRKSLSVGALAATPALLATACGGDAPATGDGNAPNANFNQKLRWKLVTAWPPNFPILQEGCVEFAKWVKAASGGRLEIQVYGSGELVPGLEAFDNVSNGVAEMGHGSPYYWAGKSAATQFFSSVPFGMNGQQMTSWIVGGGGQEVWDELYGNFNLVPFLAGNSGVQMGGWFNREINSINDLQGLKMRIPGLGGKVLAEAGGTAQVVAAGEIYTNLERGVIDATEWIGPYHDYKLGLHKIAKYYYYPGWHEPGTAFDLFVNKSKFEGLSSDLQEIVRSGAARLHNWVFAQFEAKNNEFLGKIRQESQADIRAFPKEVIERLRPIAEDVMASEGSKDAIGKKVYESFRKFRQDAMAWSELTEKIFYGQIQGQGSRS